MQLYSSKSGKESGVIGYEIGDNFIVIQFNNSEIYKYTYSSAGVSIIEKMKKLALAQKGLSTFISQKKPGYE